MPRRIGSGDDDFKKVEASRPTRKIDPKKVAAEIEKETLKKQQAEPKQPVQSIYSLENISVINARTLLTHSLMNNQDANSNNKFRLLKTALEKKRDSQEITDGEKDALVMAEQILDAVSTLPYLNTLTEQFRMEVRAIGQSRPSFSIG